MCKGGTRGQVYGQGGKDGGMWREGRVGRRENEKTRMMGRDGEGEEEEDGGDGGEGGELGLWVVW